MGAAAERNLNTYDKPVLGRQKGEVVKAKSDDGVTVTPSGHFRADAARMRYRYGLEYT